MLILRSIYNELKIKYETVLAELETYKAKLHEEVQVHSCGYTCLFMSHTLIGAGWVDMAKTRKLINCPQCKSRLTKELMTKAESVMKQGEHDPITLDPRL